MRAFPNPCPASLVFGVTILPLLDSPVLGCGKRGRGGMNMAYGSGIVVLSTALSVLTLTLWLFALKTMGVW